MKAFTQSVVYISLTREHPAEVFARRSGLVLCSVLVIAYIYFASASVFHAVMQRTAEGNIESARTELAKLEKDYFALSRNVDQAAASQLGLIKATSKSFAERSVHVGVASTVNGI